MRKLLTLVLCAYGAACHADATLSNIAPEQKPHTIKTQPRTIRREPKKMVVQGKTTATRPSATFPMKIRRAEKTTERTIVKRPPVISTSTPATKQQFHAVQARLQQQQADRVPYGRFSQALFIYTDPKSSIQRKTDAANVILESMKQLKTSEKQTAAEKRLKAYSLTKAGLEQEVTSGRAYTRIQKNASKRIKPGQDIKSDPTIAADYKKLTSYHKALADRHLATMRTTKK